MTDPGSIVEKNLSHAWARAFLYSMRPGDGEIQPLIVSVTEFANGNPLEDQHIRESLDKTLAKQGKYLCHTVANTIFPSSLWNPSQGQDLLYQRYLRILVRLKRCERNNMNGLYFERLIDFGPNKVNQLRHVIETYKGGNHRRSALQAAIFDPNEDHTNQRQRGFPCLHQVAFTPIESGGLCVTGFYAMQLIFERAYGNYLGLCRLGNFVAHELGMHLERMVCIAAVGKYAQVAKSDLRELEMSIK